MTFPPVVSGVEEESSFPSVVRPSFPRETIKLVFPDKTCSYIFGVRVDGVTFPSVVSGVEEDSSFPSMVRPSFLLGETISFNLLVLAVTLAVNLFLNLLALELLTVAAESELIIGRPEVASSTSQSSPTVTVAKRCLISSFEGRKCLTFQTFVVAVCRSKMGVMGKNLCSRRRVVMVLVLWMKF